MEGNIDWNLGDALNVRKRGDSEMPIRCSSLIERVTR
jgi:hypothetical protein